MCHSAENVIPLRMTPDVPPGVREKAEVPISAISRRPEAGFLPVSDGWIADRTGLIGLELSGQVESEETAPSGEM